MAKYNQCILCGYHANLRTYHSEYKVCSKCESEILDDGNVLDIPERKIFMTWYQVKNKCEKRGIYYDISLDDVKVLYNEVQLRCGVLGIPFNLRHRGIALRYPFMPSIDRIDPNKGFIKDNCRIVTNVVNQAKEAWGDRLFEYIFNNYTDITLNNCDKETIKQLVTTACYRTSSLRGSSNKRGLKCDINAESFRYLLNKSEYRCSITHIPFNDFNTNKTERLRQKHPLMPAIMRKDPTQGFTLDNVSLVCQFVCSAKYNFSEDIFKILFGYVEEYNEPLWFKIKDVVEAWNI